MMFSNSNGMLKNLDKMPLKSYMENQKVVLHKTYFLIRFSDHAIRPSKKVFSHSMEKTLPTLEEYIYCIFSSNGYNYATFYIESYHLLNQTTVTVCRGKCWHC